MSSSKGDGCGIAFVMALAAAALLYFVRIHSAEKEEALAYMAKLLEEVHDNLKKGKVRQALDLLEQHEADVMHAQMRADASY